MAFQTIIHTSRPSRYNVAAITKSEYGQNVEQLVHSNTVSPALRGTVKRGKKLAIILVPLIMTLSRGHTGQIKGQS